jgi:ABC-type uncharacterized transport system substrate-binding protein
MHRRAFLAGSAALLAAPVVAEAQHPGGLRRIGCLTPGDPASESQLAFQRGLRDLGYVEGHTIAFEYRSGSGRNERLQEFARELVGNNVDVLFTTGTEATAAARGATTTIPIVSVTGDPVGSGFVASLSRPGGNTTGLALVTPELSTKWMGLVRELVPRVSRVAVLQHREDGGRQLEALEPVAQQLGVRLIIIKLQAVEDITAAFETAVRGGAKAIILLSSPALTTRREAVAGLAAHHRLPAVYEHRQFVEGGGLLSYGPSLPTVFYRAAAYVDKILKGAKPADLPVEQPTTFELVINLKTAKALGLTIPPSLLLRADQVIE